MAGVNWFRNLTVVRRIQLLLAPPLTATLALGGMNLLDQHRRIADLSRVVQISTLTVQVGDLVEWTLSHWSKTS